MKWIIIVFCYLMAISPGFASLGEEYTSLSKKKTHSGDELHLIYQVFQDYVKDRQGFLAQIQYNDIILERKDDVTEITIFPAVDRILKEFNKLTSGGGAKYTLRNSDNTIIDIEYYK